jgi:predicted nucleic acid-binding protein
MGLVVDASVVVEILLRTPTGRATAPRLRVEATAAPDILDAEVAQALRRARRRGALDDRGLDGALDLLLDLPVQRLPSRLLVRGTRRWWANVTAYDALYLGVAVARDCRVLTCDGPLARAPGIGVPVENVRVA